MPVHIAFTPEAELLELSFEGSLDFTITQEVFGIIPIIPKLQDGLKTCLLDLTLIERVFDSGIALLRMLSGNLRRAGATVVVLADHPDLRRRMSLIQGDAAYWSRHEFFSQALLPGRTDLAAVH